MTTKEIFNTPEFVEAIKWAIVKFCQEHKRDIPLKVMIEGNGNVEGNTSKYKDAYGVAQDCKYADVAAFNKAVSEWNLVDNSVRDIINARLRGSVSKYNDTIMAHGAGVFVDLTKKYDWEVWADVPEELKQPTAIEIVRRQLYAFNQVATAEPEPAA